ncbi:preprotein translocase subunit SecG [Psychrosphaera saromensis]|uniref:Protein-export membrane protein SecG n=1 Tax=Psychrosphaera saromensis TaxID=716813 RepID=A0A2S7UU95_9GAMM|nr:preprotein translocase subunit SecG [Psychrosphaera saromensis]PQJ53527.1 preprotein translocase subunit SecG [Psychrosphaera saromensis]GHB64568.1 preprotein translocase subunit SecG [Psychrosphaera saromensis]GLQ15719.1 preprotein translocase subunit SecG [Psychrosphaera saromensis]
MYEILIAVYLVIALALIGLVLIQQGKGSDMGASFGAGASATLFGSNGSGNFLTKTTAILATLFFVISIFLGSLTANSTKSDDGATEMATRVAEKTVAPETDMPVTENTDSDLPAATTTEDEKSTDVPAATEDKTSN